MASFELDLPDAPGRHNTAHKAALTASRREDEDQGRVTSIDEAAFDDTDGERSGVSSFGRRQLTIASETVESGVNGKGMVEVCCSVTVVIPGESSSNGVGSETRAQERVDSHSAEPTMQKGLSVHTKVATFPRGGQPSGLSVIVFGDEASEDDEEDSRVTAMPSGPESSEDSELPAAATSAEPSPVQNGTNNRKRSETSPEGTFVRPYVALQCSVHVYANKSTTCRVCRHCIYRPASQVSIAQGTPYTSMPSPCTQVNTYCII